MRLRGAVGARKVDKEVAFVQQKNQGAGEMVQWRRQLSEQEGEPESKPSEPSALVASTPVSSVLWGSEAGGSLGLDSCQPSFGFS